MRSKTFIRIVLIAVLAVSVCSLIIMRMDISNTNREMSDINDKIKKQTLRNNELEDLLSEENEEDFYKDAAEKNFGYGKSDEKVYLDVTGQ